MGAINLDGTTRRRVGKKNKSDNNKVFVINFIGARVR